jgi:DNA-binding transcriptional ArsR family regulator
MPDLLFKALSDPTRRAIFERLRRDGALAVHDLTTGSGVSQPAVSKHLGVLRAAGLVSGMDQGRQVIYRAEPAALAPLTDWMRHYSDFWPARLDALDDLLKRMDQ